MSGEQVVLQFTDLYRQNYNRVLQFVGRRIGPGVDPEDVTADVFRAAWMQASQGAALSPGWLFVTARNVLQNQYRAVQRQGRLHESVAGEMRARLATHSASTSVRDALDRMRESDREVLVMRYWDELGAREIADVLRLSVSAVWVRLHRARRAFQHSFDNVSGGKRAIH
jgi:RNA polymerase sigma factor (sigma-70 family)